MNQQAPVSVGQIVELKIDNYGHEGEGVGRYHNFTIFIPEAIKGESVKARISEVRKNFARGELLEILQKAPERAEPPCPVNAECGGCQLQHLRYEEQLQMKRQRVVDAIERIGGLTGVTVHQTLGMAEPWYYRNKVQYPVGSRNDGVVIGFYRKGSHQIVPQPECLLQPALSNRISQKVAELLQKYLVPIYDEQTGAGLIRHLLIKSGFNSGEVMVVLVTNGEHFPPGKAIAAELGEAFSEIKSVVQNINRTRGNVILGRETRVLAGQDGIIDRLGDLNFKISALSFFQVNPIQTEALYNKAVEYAGLTGRETVLDAYCGVGSLTLFLAQRAKLVYGIEVVPEAIADAKLNASLNSMENLRFLVGETEKVLPRLVGEGVKFEVASVDPPRSGCQPEVLRSFAENGVERIVYVSCNPSTLARDLKLLGELGYRTEEVQPVDMFPQTYHVECVVLMSRVKE